MERKPVIIENKCIDPHPYFGMLGDDSYVISWKALGYVVLDMENNHIIDDKPKTYSVLPNNRNYMVRFPKGELYTNEEGRRFVNTMLNDSNFAAAGKIKHIIIRQVDGEYKYCGVLTEEF